MDRLFFRNSAEKLMEASMSAEAHQRLREKGRKKHVEWLDALSFNWYMVRGSIGGKRMVVFAVAGKMMIFKQELLG